MSKSKKPLTTVRLFVRNGQIYEFTSLDDLVSCLPSGWPGWQMINAIGWYFSDPGEFEFVSYVVKDLWGEAIDPKVVYQAWRSRNPPRIPFRARSKKAGGHTFRKDPVPGTRSRRGGGGLGIRHIQTTPERRAWYAATDDDGDPVRKQRRNPSNIPSTWDDIFRDNERRCWKRYRKTQYKPKSTSC